MKQMDTDQIMRLYDLYDLFENIIKLPIGIFDKIQKTKIMMDENPDFKTYLISNGENMSDAEKRTLKTLSQLYFDLIEKAATELQITQDQVELLKSVYIEEYNYRHIFSWVLYYSTEPIVKIFYKPEYKCKQYDDCGGFYETDYVTPIYFALKNKFSLEFCLELLDKKISENGQISYDCFKDLQKFNLYIEDYKDVYTGMEYFNCGPLYPSLLTGSKEKVIRNLKKILEMELTEEELKLIEKDEAYLYTQIKSKRFEIEVPLDLHSYTETHPIFIAIEKKYSLDVCLKLLNKRTNPDGSSFYKTYTGVSNPALEVIERLLNGDEETVLRNLKALLELE